MRWVVKFTRYDRTYYYFRRRPWPEVRIPGEPGSPQFEACYQSLLAASTAAEVERIRDRTTKSSASGATTSEPTPSWRGPKSSH